MLLGASKAPEGPKTGARSMASVSAKWRRVRTAAPFFQNRCSTAASVTQACSGTRSGLPAVMTPVPRDEVATKSSKSSWPTTRSKRKRTWLFSLRAQVAANRGLV